MIPSVGLQILKRVGCLKDADSLCCQPIQISVRQGFGVQWAALRWMTPLGFPHHRVADKRPIATGRRIGGDTHDGLGEVLATLTKKSRE